MAGCWLVLLLLATQIPQRHAPLTVADGLGRSDMAVLTALGLDRLAGSGLLWLVVALTAVVWIGRLLFVPAVARIRGDADGHVHTADRLEKGLRAASDPAPTIRRVADDRAIRIEFGALRWGRRTAFAAAALALVLFGWAVSEPAPELLEVTLGAPGTPSPVAAWTVESGHLVPATPARTGRCDRAGEGLRCSLQLAGEPLEFSLQPGGVARSGRRLVAWTGSASDPDSAAGRLLWRANGGAKGPWYALDATAGQALTVPALQARLALINSQRSGPLLFGQQRQGDAAMAFVQAAPELLPAGQATARLQTPPRVRLLLTSDLPPALLALAVVLALLAALLLFAVPGLELEVSAKDGSIAIGAGNRTEHHATIRACLSEGQQQAAEGDGGATAAEVAP